MSRQTIQYITAKLVCSPLVSHPSKDCSSLTTNLFAFSIPFDSVFYSAILSASLWLEHFPQNRGLFINFNLYEKPGAEVAATREKSQFQVIISLYFWKSKPRALLASVCDKHNQINPSGGCAVLSHSPANPV